MCLRSRTAELLEMLRKCALVGLITFVDRGSLYQLMFGVAVPLWALEFGSSSGSLHDHG